MPNSSYKIVSIANGYSMEYGYISKETLKGIGPDVPFSEALGFDSWVKYGVREVVFFTIEELLTSENLRLRELGLKILRENNESYNSH